MRKFLTNGLVAVALLAAACGGTDGAPAAVDRTVRVDMVDTAFAPETLQVAAGETVRFVFTNRGRVAHDAFVGDAGAQHDHEAEMREHSGHGDSADAITVKPGKTGELTHTFASRGRVEIGCHQSGHYAAGMKITVNVN